MGHFREAKSHIKNIFILFSWNTFLFLMFSESISKSLNKIVLKIMISCKLLVAQILCRFSVNFHAHWSINFSIHFKAERKARSEKYFGLKLHKYVSFENCIHFWEIQKWKFWIFGQKYGVLSHSASVFFLQKYRTPDTAAILFAPNFGFQQTAVHFSTKT